MGEEKWLVTVGAVGEVDVSRKKPYHRGLLEPSKGPEYATFARRKEGRDIDVVLFKSAANADVDDLFGFIRAEIVNYDDLIAAGSTAAAREKGQVRLEGKDYVMQDGDVTYFRFNV